jgi:predicted Zn-dependent peptidase
LCLALSCGQVAAQETRLVQAQDGSRFLLVPTGGPPVVHWVTLIPAGVKEDPPGLEGVSMALARATLAGTHAIGSEDPLREAAAITRARSLARQLAASGGKNPALAALLGEAEARVRRLARPLAWEKALRSAPSSGSQLLPVRGAALLRVTTTTRGLQRVAELLKDRRDRPLLRGVHGHFEQVRREREHQFAQDPRTALRRRLVAKVYQGHPFSRFYAQSKDRSLTFDAAVEAYRRLSDPKRSRYVLTGGFDVDTVEAVLKQVYEHTAEAPDRVDLPQAQASHPADRKPAADPRDTLALGCPIPKLTSIRALAVFVAWFAGDQDSYLVDALRARGHPHVQVRATVPFPAPGGLLLVEVSVPGEKLNADSKLARDLAEVLGKAMEQAPGAEQLARARQHVRARRARALASPGTIALNLARIWTITGEPPTAVLQVDAKISGAAIQQMCRQMLAEKKRTVVLPEDDA